MKEQKKELNTMQAVAAFQPEADRLFYSANHDEILAGATTDIYFVKTLEILSHLGREDAQVKAEIFARRDGIFAGIGEVKNLLQGKPGIELWALPEGAEFHYKEVVATISGPYSSFGLMETVILGMLASSCGWATAAKEIKDAAGDYPITCFGARHVHPAVAPVMERAALVGGADGASCILGAKLMGREPQGTAPHALMLIVGDTVEAALAYHKVMPDGALRLVLVDTFKDEGEESLRVAEALGDSLDGIRLDTPGERGGVTTELVKELRARLDMAGYEKVKIFVSGGLTPERVAILKEAGVDSFGVGSYISGASAIDMTMDIKEVDGKPVAKRGRIPGIRNNDRLEKLL